jgi:hypothetical protein
MKQVLEVLQGLWAIVNGRWFVWRNASTETVQVIANLEFKESDPDDLHELVKQAKEELRARGMTPLAKLNKAAEDNGEAL